MKLSQPIPTHVDIWVPAQVAAVLTPLPRLISGAPLLGFSVHLGHLHPDLTLGPLHDKTIGAAPQQAAQIIESLRYQAELAGVVPAMRAYCYQAREAYGKYRR